METLPAPMHAILDRVLEKGTNPDGLLWNAINPRTGEVLDKGLADTWGYVYNAFLTVAAVDNEPRYREAAARALGAIAKYEGYDWENGSADGYADSIESALNLLNRLPAPTPRPAWVDKSMEFLFGKQRPDGILEGWHGDGNSARTALMWALAKTQGVAASPWRDDLRLGAVRLPDGGVQIVLAGDWPWSGTLRFDRPRHRVRMHLPLDYPRINQFPEWFTADATGDYEIAIRRGAGPGRQGPRPLRAAVEGEGRRDAPAHRQAPPGPGGAAAAVDEVHAPAAAGDRGLAKRSARPALQAAGHERPGRGEGAVRGQGAVFGGARRLHVPGDRARFDARPPDQGGGHGPPDGRAALSRGRVHPRPRRLALRRPRPDERLQGFRGRAGRTGLRHDRRGRRPARRL